MEEAWKRQGRGGEEAEAAMLAIRIC